MFTVSFAAWQNRLNREVAALAAFISYALLLYSYGSISNVLQQHCHLLLHRLLS